MSCTFFCVYGAWLPTAESHLFAPNPHTANGALQTSAKKNMGACPCDKLPCGFAVCSGRCARRPRLFAQFVVFLVSNRLQPFVGGILSGNLEGKVGKPAVGSRTVPVLHVGWYVDYVAWQHLHCGLALFLVPSLAGHAHQHLPAALGGMVDVPVVAAARLERHVGERYLL